MPLEQPQTLGHGALSRAVRHHLAVVILAIAASLAYHCEKGALTMQAAQYAALAGEVAVQRGALAQAIEYKRLMEGQANAICFKVFDGGKPVAYGNSKIQGLTIVGTDDQFLTANAYTLGYGRNISPEALSRLLLS